MTRTQIYLSEAQQIALANMARARRSTHSALIREALDRFLGQEHPASRKRQRMQAFGQWGDARKRVGLLQLRREERTF